MSGYSGSRDASYLAEMIRRGEHQVERPSPFRHDEVLQLGRQVRAKRALGSAEPGELGIVYERYIIGGRPGYSVIFRNGFYDGFSPDDVDAFLEVTDHVHEHMRSYCFENVGRLQADFLAGRIWR